MKNIDIRTKKSNNVNEFFLSSKVENFFFVLACATVFTGAMLHWRLDIDHNLSICGPVLAENLIDFRHIFWIEIVLVLYYAIRKSLLRAQFKFDFALAFLVSSMILVGVIDYNREEYLYVQYAWLLPITYIVSKLVISSDSEKISERIEKLFFSLTFGMFIASAMDFYSNFRLYYYYKVFSTEAWLSYWVWSEESRCTYELGFILITATFGYMLYRVRHHKVWLASVIIINLAIQLCDISVEGRENRLLLAINLIIFLLLFFSDRWEKISTKTRNVIKGVVLAGVLSVILTIIAFLLNIAGLHDRYLGSNWSDGGGVLTNIRFKIDYAAFKLMLQYPTENYGQYTDVYAYYRQSHSMLLEYGRLNGLTVYIGLVIFRIITIKDAIVLAVKRNGNSWVKYFLIPGFISINLYYSMEPNGYAHRYFWMIGLLISGMIRGYNEVNDR